MLHYHFRKIFVTISFIVITGLLMFLNRQSNAPSSRGIFRVTAKLNAPFPYKTILRAPSVNFDATPDRLYLLILISSSPYGKSHFEKRQAIRQTWANCSNIYTLHKDYEETPSKFKCGLIFYVAALDVFENKDLFVESDKHGDMLIANYKDSYDAITHKQMLAFKWAVNAKPHYVLKTDDDVFIHVPRLIRILQGIHQPYFYGGVILSGTKVVRDKNHRHFISTQQYSETYYPPYCKGGFYVFSGNLLPGLLKAADSVPYMHVDDAYVGLLMYSLDIAAQPIRTFIHFRKFFQAFRYFVSDCALQSITGISDGLSAETILSIYERVKYLESVPILVCIHGTVVRIFICTIAVTLIALLCTKYFR